MFYLSDRDKCIIVHDSLIKLKNGLKRLSNSYAGFSTLPVLYGMVLVTVKFAAIWRLFRLVCTYDMVLVTVKLAGIWWLFWWPFLLQ
jgi:hypothetical protein